MDTGEVFGWIFFFVFVSILFFAAFGSASVTEDTVEDLMNDKIRLQKIFNETEGGALFEEWFYKK